MITALLIFMASFNVDAKAYETGSAPFCKMDDYGNLQCFYYTLSQCQSALSSGYVCVRR